ncbi:hypothetical protein Slin15195_G002260 [Septoria linicola]|uniref:Uncharacterized protein n=1 Tax=Septoria linicola TaxID=215465 RepID=A0A9Q9EEV0_9PEZI|nr:hypothetical protein Slin14017_G002280 [Septoria linicola]USW46907.1 hypothetical protein Slin15195_G002260 [Septoria linicola]
MPEQTRSTFSDFFLNLGNKMRSTASRMTQSAPAKDQEPKPLNADHAAVERIMGPPKDGNQTVR